MTVVYKAINKVQAALAKEGIAKDRSGQGISYKFRGIDDIYNALSGLLAEHGLCILPRVISRDVTERTNKNGTVLFYVIVDVEYDFIASEDGSKHTVKVYGEAMDSGDKGTNKALSAAYKYACMQAFCIPTEGESVDSERDTHEVNPRPVAQPPRPATPPIRQANPDHLVDLPVLPDGTLDYDYFGADLEEKVLRANSVSELTSLKMTNGKSLNRMKADRPEMFAAIVQAFTDQTNKVK